ncbi:UNVERIFIED_CONTAM: hypothetical protein Sradi_5717400 [Sesamum radiatum]|uniref:Uncharacterized protein n=1 Tax=Sesamum radiatum TaxID=300843 RepID=A0AAW2L5M9_SESRA
MHFRALCIDERVIEKVMVDLVDSFGDERVHPALSDSASHYGGESEGRRGE